MLQTAADRDWRASGPAAMDANIRSRHRELLRQRQLQPASNVSARAGVEITDITRAIAS